MSLRFGIYCEMQSAPEKSHPELIWEVCRLMEQADAAGYSVFSLIEHHCFPSFGISANPLAMFTAVAQRTKQLRFRTLCHTLPLHNPIVLAGQIGEADILTNGRLELGVGRGHGWLYPPLGISVEESQKRYREALEILHLAFTQDRFSYHGEFWDVEDVGVVPKPLQRPYPKVYMTGTSGAGFAEAAERGWGIVCGGPAPYEVFEGPINIYLDACKKHQTTPDLGYVRAVFLAEDEETAHREARDAILNFFEFNVRPHDTIKDDDALKQRLNASGYAFYASNVMQELRKLSYDDVIGAELAWVGTPKQIARKLEDFHRKVGFNEFNIMSHYGNIPEWAAARTQQLFAREVMPAFA